jgi:hypothetical protein
MAESIKKRTAEAILETPFTVKVGSKEYEVAPPSCATLIEVSRRIPDVPLVETMGDMVNEALAAAKDSRAIFEIVAVLILGAKALRRGEKVTTGRWPFRRTRSRLDALTEELMYECSPAEIKALCGEILARMEVKDFFEFTASLQEVGLIQLTRGAETTASGQ